MEGCNFPEDILVEILCFLPKKSLARFKCVSKRWYVLISDRNRVFPKTTHVGLVCQSFVRCQLHRSSNAMMERSSRMDFLHLDNKGRAYLESFKLNSKIEKNYSLQSSCNGFLLFRCELMTYDEDYVVYHPATQRSWNLIPPTAQKAIHVGLASSGHHFKIVRIFFLDSKRIRSEVYSSQNEEWWEEFPPRSFTIPRIGRTIGVLDTSVFVKGALHWAQRNDILIYHLEDGDCEFVKLPRVSRMDREHCIWDSEGYLNYCCVSRNNRIFIWTLHRGNWSSNRHKYSFRWKVKHKGILAPPFAVTDDSDYSLFSPVAFNDEFATVYLMYSTQVFSYNLETRETKEACISPFEGSSVLAWLITLPFEYLTQFDKAAMAMGDGESSIHALKRRKMLSI